MPGPDSREQISADIRARMVRRGPAHPGRIEKARDPGRPSAGLSAT